MDITAMSPAVPGQYALDVVHTGRRIQFVERQQPTFAQAQHCSEQASAVADGSARRSISAEIFTTAS